ncbi:hypothetical protein EG329_014189 [Mollisiaceae sp. DMI_Dod_QoI]|nr:hypothetical protein EG329_014189 [Helotiales sp. DMI_Dod_QoI]
MLSLLAESWTCVSRWLQLGSIKAFQLEDYIMLLVLGFYTSLVSFMNIVAHLDTNLMLPTDIPTLTPASIASRIHGSKLVLVVEQSMIMTQWGCKICLLLLYNKLTFGLKQQVAVKIVGAYVITNLIVMEILYFGVWCRPFDQYWAVPVANEQCSAALHHLITNAVFNITSDIMMLCIPLPLLIRSQLPRANKLILCCLFGLGIFVILCAVLNKYYSFAHPFSPMWEFWYIREASTAILVANMPMCWSLMRRLFKLRAFSGLSSSNGQRSKSLPIATVYSGAVSRANGGAKDGSRILASKIDRSEKSDTSNSWWDREGRISPSDSEEYIVGGMGDGKSKGKDVPLEIWESREVEVDRGSVSDADARIGRGMGTGTGDSMRTKMYDGSTDVFETRTVVTAKTSSPLGRRSESGSR